MIKDLLTSVGVKAKTASSFAPIYEEMFPEYGVNTDIRTAHFFAQILHESAMLERLREIWGPTPDQVRYERDFKEKWDDSQLAFRLGNVKLGDGKRFMGRGAIQRTGRWNTQDLMNRTGIDFVGNPALLEQPRYATLSDLDYWKKGNLNRLADQDDGSRIERPDGLLYNNALVKITKKINPGLRGLLDREKMLYKLKKSLNLPE